MAPIPILPRLRLMLEISTNLPQWPMMPQLELMKMLPTEHRFIQLWQPMQDATANLTYSITGGNADGVFTIDANTGEITIADNTNLDRETTASYALTVEASDGTNTDNATITVNVGDINEFAPVANDATVAINEDAANGAIRPYGCRYRCRCHGKSDILHHWWKC